MRMKIKYQINERYLMKKKDKLLREQVDRFLQFKEPIGSYVAIENRSKALEESRDNKSFELNDPENSENNQYFHR